MFRHFSFRRIDNQENKLLQIVYGNVFRQFTVFSFLLDNFESLILAQDER